MKQENRNYTIDIVRLIAAFGVIALHVKVMTSEARAVNDFFWPLCVPFFYLTSVTYFVAGFYKEISIREVFIKAYRRIIVPYFVWTALYMSLFLAKGIITGNYRKFIFWRAIFYGESAVQLYFLPTLLLIQFSAFAIFLLIQSDQRSKWGAGILMICLTYLIWGEMHNCFGIAAPGSFIGIVGYILLAFYFGGKIKIVKSNFLYGFIGFFLLVFAVISNYFGYKYFVFKYPILFLFGGSGLLLLSIGFPLKKIPKWLLVLTSFSFGIYLCHVIFLEAIEYFLEKKYSIQYDLKTKLFVIMVIFILSSLFTYILLKFRVLSTLFLGEKNR